jgi:membrane-associated protein
MTTIAESFELGRDLLASPWVYLVLFAFAAVDAFFPAVPSETAVITAGVFAASGAPDLAVVVAVSAAGAFAGDHVSYLIGRTGGGRQCGRRAADRRLTGRRAAALDWAGRAVAERGGQILVVARYIPGGRTATTLTMGALGYRLRSFTAFAALAALSWSLYAALVGYLGGAAFQHDPVKGLLLGLGVAAGITVAVEVARRLRHRRGGAGGTTVTSGQDRGSGPPDRAGAAQSASSTRPAS